MSNLSKRDLIAVIGKLQIVIGMASSAAANDRSPHRQAQTQGILEWGHNLCIEATGHFPSDYSDKSKWEKRELPDYKSFV